MSRILRAAALAVVIAFGVLVANSTGSESAYTTARLRLREAPAVSSSIVATVPRGKRISVFSGSEGWCQASYDFRSGYVSQSYLSDTPPPGVPQASRSGRGYINSRGEWVPSPTWTAAGRAPVRASARCWDDSYSFSRSRRGTCSHHGGVRAHGCGARRRRQRRSESGGED